MATSTDMTFHNTSYKDYELGDDIYNGIHSMKGLRINLRHSMRFFRLSAEYLDDFTGDDDVVKYIRQIVALQGAYARLARLYDDETRQSHTAYFDEFHDIMFNGLTIVSNLLDSIPHFYPPEFQMVACYD
jgi:hypothetical protein